MWSTRLHNVIVVAIVFVCALKAISSARAAQNDRTMKPMYPLRMILGGQPFNLTCPGVHVFQDGKEMRIEPHRVGSGGSKTAYAMKHSEYVILLPNAVDAGVSGVPGYWRRIVKEEAFWNDLYESSGVLTSAVRECQVSNNLAYPAESVPVLISPNFEHLMSERSMLVLDPKAPQKDGVLDIWTNHSLPSDAEGWLDFMEPLVRDLEKLVLNKLNPPWGDAVSYVVMEAHDDPDRLQMRLFPFDFASKMFTRAATETDWTPYAWDREHLKWQIDLATEEIAYSFPDDNGEVNPSSQSDTVRSLAQDAIEGHIQKSELLRNLL